MRHFNSISLIAALTDLIEKMFVAEARRAQAFPALIDFFHIVCYAGPEDLGVGFGQPLGKTAKRLPSICYR
jgi:hypothetical protein